VKGFPVREWTKKAGARNEALDCLVYAYAALQYLYTKHSRKTFFEQFERQLRIRKDSDINKEPKDLVLAALPKEEDKTTIKKVSPIKNKSFVTRW
jgi:phage terminase large subunit GpA-like protein